MSGRYSPDDRDRDYRREREPRDDSWQKEPVNTVLIKNVPDEINETDLYQWFSNRDINIKAVRLISKKPGNYGNECGGVSVHLLP